MIHRSKKHAKRPKYVMVTPVQFAINKFLRDKQQDKNAQEFAPHTRGVLGDDGSIPSIVNDLIKA